MIFAMNKSPRRLDTYEEVDLLMKKEIFIKNIKATSKQLISALVIKHHCCRCVSKLYIHF